MPQFSSISTERLDAKNKVALWQKSAWLETGHSASRLIHANSFNAFLEYGSLDQIRLYRLSVTPHQLISFPAAGQNGSHSMVKVILQVKGTTLYDQMGRQVLLEPGSWMLRDLDLPYVVNILEPCELIVAMLPRSTISTAGFALRDLCLRRFSGAAGLGHIVHNVIQTTYQEFEQLEEAVVPDIASAMTQLIRLQLLQVCKELNHETLREVLKARVMRYVASHLRTPDLSLDQIARFMRCTKRNLHKAFESEDASLAEYILNMRLDRCRDALAKSFARQESITSVALSWGFSSGASLSRAFQKRFHTSPSEYRASVFGGVKCPEKLDSARKEH